MGKKRRAPTSTTAAEGRRVSKRRRAVNSDSADDTGSGSGKAESSSASPNRVRAGRSRVSKRNRNNREDKTAASSAEKGTSVRAGHKRIAAKRGTRSNVAASDTAANPKHGTLVGTGKHSAGTKHGVQYKRALRMSKAKDIAGKTRGRRAQVLSSVDEGGSSDSDSENQSLQSDSDLDDVSDKGESGDVADTMMSDSTGNKPHKSKPLLRIPTYETESENEDDIVLPNSEESDDVIGNAVKAHIDVLSGGRIPPTCTTDGQRAHATPGTPTFGRDIEFSVTQLLNASVSQATKRTYQNAMSIYKSFLVTDSIVKGKYDCLPISESSMARFIVFLMNTGYKPSSIQTNIAALGSYHNILGFPSPATSFIIKKLILGAKRIYPSQDQRLPVTLHILHKLVRAIGRLFSSPYEKRMYSAMVLVAFHALLRVGEHTTKGGKESHVIQRENVKFSVKNGKLEGMTITLLHYKHSKREVTLELGARSKIRFCPVNALASHIGSKGISQGPIFINQDGSPVSSSQFSSVFKLLVKDAGLNPSRYKPHGLRIGGATWSHSLNLSDSKIREMGRWKSDSFKRYIRIPMADKVHAYSNAWDYGATGQYIKRTVLIQTVLCGWVASSLIRAFQKHE